MAYALRTSAGPIEFDPSQPVRIGEGDDAITYVVPWNGDDLVAAYPSQVGAIVEPDPVPAGKVATGSSLTDDGTAVRRVWALADAPAPSVPDSVGPAQAKTALYNAGKLDAAQAAITAANYQPMTIYWDSATIWRRSHPYLQGLAASLDLSDDDVDNLFRAAAALE